MPVDFQFDRLRIEGFRGISDFELPFSRGVPTYLIGGNNTGKSTLLDAFALALRGGGFHAYDVEDFDFHRNRRDGQVADEFVITVHFKATRAEDLPAVQGVGEPNDYQARAGIRSEPRSSRPQSPGTAAWA